MTGTDAAPAWGALLAAHAAVAPRIERRLRDDAGMTLTTYDVLSELAVATDGPLRIGDLSERVLQSRSRVCRVVVELCDAGLATHSPNPEDGRSWLIAPTPEGLASYRRAERVYRSAIDEEFASKLEPGEAEVLGKALKRIVGTLCESGVDYLCDVRVASR